MNELFVPYAESLELKELGFDESCFGWYDGRYTQSVNRDYCKNSEDWLNTIHCASPIFSQAFKFFREKYNLFGTILSDGFNGRLKGYYYSITEEGWINCYESIDDGKWYDTYEEAELQCLRKLIEIAKTEKS